MKNQKIQKSNNLPRYRNHNNAQLFPTDYETIDPVSITEPNQTYSLRDIVEKFSKEYPKHLLRTGYYDQGENDEDFDDIDPTRQPDFDLVDAMELKEQIRSKQKIENQVFKKPEKTETNTTQNLDTLGVRPPDEI